MKTNNEDTICAISTPPGIGGIAVIRISGTDAYKTADKIFTAADNKPISAMQANTLKYGTIHDSEGNIVDQAVASLYKTPHSFTGEDTVELSCHGSIYIQQKILTLLIENGSRLAMPGEFTRRAFINGKIDLAQAEGVADLISATTAASHRLAINQMRGKFSANLKELRDKIINLASLIELELDFTEEDVEFADRKQLTQTAQQINKIINTLRNSFTTGNAIKNGIPVAIIGETNTGKSTLLNLLVGEERAIVSDVHGTTRDTIEDTVVISGTLYRFIDTAGIRNTTDTIEKIGIERTYNKIDHSEIILWLTDITANLPTITTEIKQHSNNKKLIMLLNKSDKLTEKEIAQRRAEIQAEIGEWIDLLPISAKTGYGIDTLQEQLTKNITQATTENEIIVTNVRHYQALTHAGAAIQRVIEGIENNTPDVLIAQDLREATHYIGEITGEITASDLLQTIFSKFCIGK